ncbi:MAG: MarR family transcriptional regulator [Prolixibacteraceae bacterium]|jgi:DNA-binding MarR family transcriptional regulator
METGKSLGYLLGQSLRAYKSLLVETCRKQEIELTFEQFVILQKLHSNCDIIQQDLANHLQKDKSIIVRQINGLLEKQLVTRHTNLDDKRKKNLVLTPKGHLLLTELKDIVSEITGKLLSGIPENEVTIFRNILAKIHENGAAVVNWGNCHPSSKY